MYNRTLLSKIKEFAKKYPVVTLLGPRQSGKTTLVKLAFPNKPYVNMEDADLRLLATDDPKGFMENYPKGAIFDEIQRTPHLLSFIQVAVDKEEIKGKYILTGSHQAQLHSAVSQSLAGRTTILKLLPLSLEEMRKSGIQDSIEEIILKGGYPKIYKDDLPISNAYSSYLQTYVERDVRQILQLKDHLQFERFLKLVASRLGQLVNYSSLAADVGVSSTTIKEWISVLEATYILIRLEPFFENFGKRLIKAPKLYFLDTGLACHLLGIETHEQLVKDTFYGNLFENWVILDLIKYKYNRGLTPNYYFYRDSLGREVDLIVQKGSKLIPIEIKSTKTYSSSFIKNLKYLKDQASKRVHQGAVIYGGNQSQKLNEFTLLNIENATDTLMDSQEEPSIK